MAWGSTKGGAVGTSYSGPESTEELAVAEIDRLNKEDVGATRRMLALAADTQAIAAGVSETLHTQGEQIARTKEKAQGIQGTLKSLAGTMKSAFRRGGKSGGGSNGSPQEGSPCAPSSSFATSTSPDTSPQREAGRRTTLDTSPSKAKAGQDGSPSLRKGTDNAEDEIDQNLDLINGMLDDLKGQALGIGEELDRQTQMLGQLDNEVSQNLAGAKAATQAVGKPRRWQSELNKVEDKMKAAATTLSVSTGGLL